MHAPLPEPPSRETLRALLRDRFGHDRFRPGQERALRALLAGRDVLALLPTGAGKSLVYQLASQLLPGVTVVVSPLLALMRDQEEALEGQGVEVSAIDSTRSPREAAAEIEKVERGESRLLYVTPERFLNEEFVRLLKRLKVSLLVVDEAHCVSEWGHSFRPAYLALGSVARQIGRPTLLALTATATPWVRRDIAELLELRDPATVVHGSDRPNLFLEVQRVETEADEHRALRRHFAPDEATDDGSPAGRADSDRHPDANPELRERLAAAMLGPGIVYTATTRGARETAAWLQSWGIAADFYHGRRTKRDRARVQDAFMAGDLRVIAATNAFGLGVDKPDVRFVVHRDAPASLEAYYQEAGRAGRDGELARCLLLYRPADLGRAAFLSGGGSISREDLERVCAALLEHGELSARRLTSLSGLGQPTVIRAVALLEHEAVVGRRRGRIRLLGERCDLGGISLEAEERRRAYESSRLAMMRGYAELAGCRREFVLNYFGEPYDPEACQMCDNSRAPTVQHGVRHPVGAFAVGTAVRHHSWGAGIVERVTSDSVTVLFDSVGFKTLDLALVGEKGLLEPAAA